MSIMTLCVTCLACNAKKDDFPVLTGPYLGQKPPRMTPEKFALGIVTTEIGETCPAFSPDGKRFIFMRYDAREWDSGPKKYATYMKNRTGDYDPWWVSTKVMEVLDPSPLSYKILSENGRIIIPFEFHRNKFRFNAKINGRTCNMMLDNGSLWDQLLFFGSPRVDSIGFKITGETSIGKTKADTATDITVRFKDVVFYDQAAVITRYDPKLPNPWEGFDGQISATFFKHFAVRIDFDKTVIELIPFGKFTYSGKGQALTMQPGPFASRTIIADIITRNGETVTLDMLIDLGGLYPLYLPIGRDDRISLPPDAVKTTLGKGLFVQEGYLGTVNGVRLGGYFLKNVPATFIMVEKESNIYGNTMIGLPLLRRFNIVFDYSKNRIILEPSKKYNDPFWTAHLK